MSTSVDSKSTNQTASDDFVLVKVKAADMKKATAVVQTAVDYSSAGAGNKDAKASTATATKPLGLLRRVTAGTGLKYGLKPLTIVLPISVQVSNTSASVCAAVLPVDVSASAEWSSLQQLYDQYRFKRGCIKMLYFANGNSFTPPSSLSDTMFVVAWDPVDQSALTSVRQGAELAQHRLSAPPVATQSGTAIQFSGTNPYDAAGTAFKFAPVNKVMAITASGTVNESPGCWKELPNSGSNGSPDGVLKFYNYNGLANGVAVVGAILFVEVELRSRK